MTFFVKNWLVTEKNLAHTDINIAATVDKPLLYYKEKVLCMAWRGRV